MANISLKMMLIGFIVSVFFVVFGGGYIYAVQLAYELPTEPTLNTVNNSFTGYQENFSQFAIDNEDAVDGIQSSGSDSEGILGTINTFKTLLGFRSDVANVKDQSQEVLWFLPKELWLLIGILITIILMIVVVSFFWKWDGGLQG